MVGTVLSSARAGTATARAPATPSMRVIFMPAATRVLVGRLASSPETSLALDGGNPPTTHGLASFGRCARRSLCMDAAAVSRSPRRSAGRLLRAAGDDRLVARVRAGDDAAFEVIYDRHHAALLAFCRHMLGSQEEAEDALQQVFMSAHRSLRVDQRAIALKPWLYALART